MHNYKIYGTYNFSKCLHIIGCLQLKGDYAILKIAK